MTGTHRRKRSTSTEDYGLMLGRMLRAYGTRIGQDPEAGLAAVAELRQALDDAVNLGIHTANQVGDAHGERWSVNRLGDLLGISKQSAHARVRAGEAVAKRRVRKAGQVRATVRRQLPPGS